ncbi:MAG TPA: SRPBCC domain-containing protein [Dehalococcoidia bacterium]|nr:SRPBCC domain-containing protein [Dehalococcoidia bacterium]
MKLEHRCLVPASRDAAWELLLDVPRVAPCIPGLKEIAPDGPDRYRAALQARVGPMSFNLTGTIQVLGQDRAKGEARFLVDAQERRVGGSVRADLTVQLNSHPSSAQRPEQTELVILTDAAFLGRLGELGQPVIRRKASATVQEFADNLAQLLGRSSA